MTCIWNGNLHRHRANRNNKYCQKQFLNPDHWIQNPKSREHNKHMQFVVRIRIGPVTSSLKKLIDLKLKENSHLIPQSTNMCTPRLTLEEEKVFIFEERHAHKAHAATSKDMHQWLGLTSSYPSSTNWNSFMPMLSDPQIYQETLNLKSLNDCIHFIYKLAPWMPHNIDLLYMNIPYGMPQLQHYSSGQQILNHTSLESHRLSLCSFLLRWLHTTNAESTQRDALQPFCNHLK